MNPFFIAHGPAFKKGFVMETINNVDIYVLICHIMGIEPAENRGNLDHVTPMLSGKLSSTAAEDSSFFSTTMVSCKLYTQRYSFIVCFFIIMVDW